MLSKKTVNKLWASTDGSAGHLRNQPPWDEVLRFARLIEAAALEQVARRPAGCMTPYVHELVMRRRARAARRAAEENA